MKIIEYFILKDEKVQATFWKSFVKFKPISFWPEYQF
jgi:hypothetical protein